MILKEWIAIGANGMEQGLADLGSWQAFVRSHTDRRVEPYLDEIRQWSLIMTSRDRGPEPAKLNCWDVMHCGRAGEGFRGRLRGTCAVRTEERLNGIHGGKNGGRACWTVRHTLCAEMRQGAASTNERSCSDCRFFRLVHAEERQDHIVADAYLNDLLF